jgi:hypothetical protein
MPHSLLEAEDEVAGPALVELITGVARPQSADDRDGWRRYRRARKNLYQLVDYGLPVYRRFGCREYIGRRPEIAAWCEAWRARVEAAGPAGLRAKPVPRRPITLW